MKTSTFDRWIKTVEDIEVLKKQIIKLRGRKTSSRNRIKKFQTRIDSYNRRIKFNQREIDKAMKNIDWNHGHIIKCQCRICEIQDKQAEDIIALTDSDQLIDDKNKLPEMEEIK